MDKFEDFMVKDTKTGVCYWADKLLEEHVEKVLKKKAGKLKAEEEARLKTLSVKADTFTQEELKTIFEEEKILSPDTGN